MMGFLYKDGIFTAGLMKGCEAARKKKNDEGRGDSIGNYGIAFHRIRLVSRVIDCPTGPSKVVVQCDERT